MLRETIISQSHHLVNIISRSSVHCQMAYCFSRTLIEPTRYGSIPMAILMCIALHFFCWESVSQASSSKNLNTQKWCIFTSTYITSTEWIILSSKCENYKERLSLSSVRRVYFSRHRATRTKVQCSQNLHNFDKENDKGMSTLANFNETSAARTMNSLPV